MKLAVASQLAVGAGMLLGNTTVSNMHYDAASSGVETPPPVPDYQEGYAWGTSRSGTDPSACPDMSWSFRRGCIAALGGEAGQL